MAEQTLRDHPHLPLLTFAQSMAIFELAGINFNRLAFLTGYSRQSLYLWRRGRAPHWAALDRVSTLAWKALAAVKAGAMPLPVRSRLERSYKILTAISLADVSADILPADLNT